MCAILRLGFHVISYDTYPPQMIAIIWDRNCCKNKYLVPLNQVEDQLNTVDLMDQARQQLLISIWTKRNQLTEENPISHQLQ